MTTSANVTHYYVYRDGHLVGRFKQHHYCKDQIMSNLDEYRPDDRIEAVWPDEYEAPHVMFDGTVEEYKNRKRKERDRG
jgi:hypothetical protein